MIVKKGIALVIGNSDYTYQTKLMCCKNDTNDMVHKFRELHFDVLKAIDLERKKLYEKIDEFIQKAHSYSTIVFYYSGHGVQVDGRNYLVPIDCKYNSNKQIFINTSLVDLSIISEYINKHPEKVNIIILDACRDNLTFTKGFTVKGLTTMNVGSGTYIAFATAPDTSAIGGLDTENSIFTKYLLKHIDKVNIKIEDMFKFVRKDVEKETNGTQKPWDNSSLTSDYYFNIKQEDTINETIYQLIRNHNCAETLIYLSNMTNKSISDVLRVYQHQKSEKPGGIYLGPDNFESYILQQALNYGFKFANYRWCYGEYPVVMGDFFHNHQTFKVI